MLSEKEAIEIVSNLKTYYEAYYLLSNEEIEENEEKNEAIKIVLNLITRLEKENKEKDKIIYEIAKSNVELKGYEIKEEYINNTVSFFTKYTKNLEKNPHWRKK